MVELRVGSESSSLEDDVTDRETHDLACFDLSAMIRCGREVRSLAQGATSMEAAAQMLVRYLQNSLIDPRTGKSECVLVRCFKTHRLGKLPQDLRAKAEKKLGTLCGEPDQLACLTLLASAGDLGPWNDRAMSAHAVIPLESVEVVERAPMIAQLIWQMGLEIGAVLDPSSELMLEAEQRAYNVFHVPHALGSASIPAQDFVKQHKVESVLGLGGMLPSGDLFSVILFSRVPIDRETANLFRTVALSVKLILLPFVWGPVFEGEPLSAVRTRSQRHEEEIIRSEIATLHLLIPALEDAALSQTSRLEGAVLDLELRGDEVQRLGARLSSVLESTTDAVFMLDRQWNFTYLNRHAEKLLHKDRYLLGANIWEEFPAAVNSSFWTNYHRAMQEAVPVTFEEYYPAPLDRWFDVHAFPSDEGLAVFFHDVTDFRVANTALIKNEKLAAVGRLAASIAHEINNPLESVTNLLFLAQASEDVKEIHGYLDIADRELRRIGAITSQTLRFHRQASLPTSVRPSELIQGVLSIYQGRIVNAQVKVEHRERNDKPIVCFEGEVRQVLNNLVSNAIDAMYAGGRLLIRERAGTDWKTGRRGVFLSVADTGMGMSENSRAKVFDAFFSTKGLGGTGLGLWISKGIVERHAGRILLKSSPAEGRSGTVFCIFLPFVMGDGEPVADDNGRERLAGC
jgi:signal transduction histidine kinase